MQNKESPHRNKQYLTCLFSKSLGDFFFEILERPKHQTECFLAVLAIGERALEAFPLFIYLWSLNS